MKITSNNKLNFYKKILLSFFIVLLLMLMILVCVIQLQQKTVYADTASNSVDEELFDSEIDEELEESLTYYASGWVPETSQVKLSVPEFSTANITVPLDEVVDYADAFPSPGNQGKQESCTAWAVGYAAKSYLVNIGQKWGVKDYQFSPSYIYNQINGGVDNGSSIYDAMKLVIEQGVCLLSDMPYNQNDFTTQPTRSQVSLASQYCSLKMERIVDGNVNDMKATLKTGIPIVIGIPIYPDFDNIKASNPIYDTDAGKSRGNHAICLIGYDDNKDAFKFINSWGVSWGLNGYGYISYSLIETFETTGWVLYDAKFGQFADSQFAGTELTKYIPISNPESSISIISGITKIGNFAFANQTHITDITLPSTLTSIGNDAFSGCNNLTSISSLNFIEAIGDRAFMNCSKLTYITILSRPMYLGDGVFAGCNNLNINVSVVNQYYTAQGNILYNKAKTKIISTGKISPYTIIPDTVTEIGAYAFYGNSNLEALQIDDMPIIGTSAFANCENLNSVYFYSYTVPQIGASAFIGDDFTLYVPHSKQGAYVMAFAGYTSRIDSIPITITFVSDGETINLLNTYYGANIIGLTDPFKTGYNFDGWYDNVGYIGYRYQNNGLWDSARDLTVYAKWTARQFYISFSGTGTEGIKDKLVTYDEPIGALPVLYIDGCEFLGWKDEYGKYYNENTIWQRTSNLTLYSDYTEIEYNVILDKQGGSGGTDSVKATYLSDMRSATKPTRTGYTFQGYFAQPEGKGTMYYDANMNSAHVWDIEDDDTIYAYWKGNQYTVTLDNQNGTGGTPSVTATYGSPMPTSNVTAPTRAGYMFKGYFSEINGYGKKYYDGPNMDSVHDWDQTEDTTLYAYWEKIYYTVTLHYCNEAKTTREISVAYGEMMPLPISSYAPVRSGYEFVGYFSEENGGGTQYYSMKIMTQPDAWWDYSYYEGIVPERAWDHFSDGDLYACWKLLECKYTYENVILNEGYLEPSTVCLKHGENKITAESFSGYKFLHFLREGMEYDSPVKWKIELERSAATGLIHPKHGFFAVYEKESCIAEGTLITLADGTRVPVEQLKGDEMLLVWNLFTGTFDTAPILFIDYDPAAMYEVINLYFSDGTEVKVISEHAFWDFDLNEYVYLDSNAAEYIGHWFNKQITTESGELYWTKVQLTDVIIQEEYTTAWSPITYGHLCYYVNGMLSIPGGIEGLFNIFDVDGETLTYNSQAMAEDIAQYGLFTYEEFVELLPVPEEIFNAFSGQYLKVAIGKGLINFDTLTRLVERYQQFF